MPAWRFGPCIAAALAVALAACDAAGGIRGGGGDGTRTIGPVTGTWRTTYWLESGARVDVNETPGPDDGVAAIVGTGATATRHAGTLNADGTFSIPDLPPGPYVLELRLPTTPPGSVAPTRFPIYVDETGRDLDLGWDVFGRPGVEYATATNPVTFELSGLSPTTSLDWVQLVAPNVGGVATAYSSPTAGSTSGSVVLSWSRLLEAAKGDGLWGHQLRWIQTSVGGTTTGYRAAGSSAHVTSASIAEAPGQTVALSMSAMPTATTPIDMRTSQFAAYDDAVSASRVPGAIQSVSVLAFPHSVTSPAPFAGGSVPAQVQLLLFLQPTPSTADVSLGTLSYGRYPGWNELRLVQRQVPISLAVPGATSPLTFTVVLMRADVMPAPTPIVPAVSPPRSLLVNGADARVDRTGIGTTPTISWTAPALGTPSRYAVNVSRIQISGGAPSMVTVASLRTARTSVTIPAGVMEEGASYVVSVVAATGSLPWSTAPRRRGLDGGYASAPAYTAVLRTTP